MPTQTPRSFSFRLAFVGLALLSACDGERSPSALTPGDSRLAAKSGSGGSTSLTVASSSPTQATQDTALSVTVTGTGFTTGARAVWALDGDTTLVHVKSTKVMGSTQLVAQLVIPLGAPVASYDIQVLLVDGKKGVGADLFTVTSKDPTAQFSFPLNDAGLGVKSDHLYVAGDQSVYAQAICGVDAKIFATTQFSNSGDAVMQTNNKQWADRACANYPRKISIDYGDGTAPQWTTIFMNVRDLQRDNVLADQMPVGTTRLRGLNIQDTRCGAFVYMGTMADGTSTNGADSVLVTRTSATTWLVQSQPAPNDKMYCKGDGKLYHVPVQFTVIRNLP